MGNPNPYTSSFSENVDKAVPVLAELLGIEPGHLCYTLIGIDGSGRIMPVIMANTSNDKQVVSMLCWVLAKMTGKDFMDMATVRYDVTAEAPEPR